jgi:hypothetical protein
VGDGTGVDVAVGAGVIVGFGDTAMSVGTGRGVVTGPRDGHPDGSSARLRVVMVLT